MDQLHTQKKKHTEAEKEKKSLFISVQKMKN